MSVQLTEYQQQYLAARPLLLLKQKQEQEQKMLIKKTEYANKIYRDFYIGNGSKNMKRATNNVGVYKFYNWLSDFKNGN